MAVRVRDLSDDLPLTFQLLVSTHTWRHRLVEQVVLGSAEHYTVRRSYQIEIPAELLATHGVRAKDESVRVLVPLTTLPKAPLLGFDLVGPEGAAPALELRRSGAAVQALYLASLAVGDELRQARIDDAFPDDLLEAICAYTPAYFSELLEAHDLDLTRATGAYLADGLGFEVAARHLDEALIYARWAGHKLSRVLGEPFLATSSSENVLLALPLMGEGAPRDGEGVVRLAERFYTGVVIADELNAHSFLSTLAEYGRRWEALTELELPCGTPSIVKIVDRRPLELSRPTRSLRRGLVVRFDVALGDAASYHVAVKGDDEALRLVDWHAETADGQDVPLAVFEGVKQTRELLTLYTSATERPYHVRIATRVAAAGHVRAVSIAVSFLTLLSAWGVLVGSAEPDRLGVFTVPTTFAVGLLQFRERVTLLARLQRGWSTLMLVTLLVLWVSVFVRLSDE